MDNLCGKACIIENANQYRKFKKLIIANNISLVKVSNPTFPIYMGIVKPAGKEKYAVSIFYEMKNGTNGLLDCGYIPLTYNQFEQLFCIKRNICE